MKIEDKIIPYSSLANWRNSLDSCNRPLVVTNGCFDVIHPGHLLLLEQAQGAGNALLVGVNCDSAIRLLKGPNRPVLSENHRVTLLAALESVSAVCVFPEIDACEFLARSRPDIYFKGGNYSVDTINQDERLLLDRLGAKIQFSGEFEGHSTSILVNGFAKRFSEDTPGSPPRTGDALVERKLRLRP
jgi:D-glycero-beta-D-manno-heptose 1-phosphate adenylyltransferase